MKRNMKLINKILKWTEQYADSDPKLPPEMEEYKDAEINYHISLCLQAGYLTAEYEPTDHTYRIINLTWDGHEELDRR